MVISVTVTVNLNHTGCEMKIVHCVTFVLFAAVEAVAVYDYWAQEDDELTLKVGDVIHNVVKMNGGWWQGVLNGRKGVFPDNFVKVSNAVVTCEIKLFQKLCIMKLFRPSSTSVCLLCRNVLIVLVNWQITDNNFVNHRHSLTVTRMID